MIPSLPPPATNPRHLRHDLHRDGHAHPQVHLPHRGLPQPRPQGRRRHEGQKGEQDLHSDLKLETESKSTPTVLRRELRLRRRRPR